MAGCGGGNSTSGAACGFQSAEFDVKGGERVRGTRESRLSYRSEHRLQAVGPLGVVGTGIMLNRGWGRTDGGLEWAMLGHP